MAAEVSAMPGINGYGQHNGYGGIEQQQHQNGNAYNHNGGISQGAYGQAPPATSTTPATTASSQGPEIAKDEVGWYFVEQYYTTLSRSPEKLYLFYNKRSQLVSGQETEKMDVCVGQRAINDKIKELDFQDCKVRVTNVDSQASDSNIVIQVIGEISNKSQPHRKFTQTFVLATQTNGYFVLNDIFRYLVDEEEETAEETAPEQQEEVQQVAPAAESGNQEPAPTTEQAEPKTLTSSMDPIAIESDAKAVDQQLEEKVLKEPTKTEEEPAPAVNGAAEPGQAEETNHVEEAPAAAVEEPEQPSVAEPEQATAEPELQPEAPKAPTPSPAPTPAAPAQQAPSQPAAPPKPAGPKTWASLAASAARVATPAAPAAPTTTSQPRQTQPAPKAAPQTQAAPAAPSTPAAPQEESSATTSTQDEWNTVGGNHNRSQSRQAPVQQEQGPQSRGYIKNVHEGFDINELRAHLEQFGELTYFDIARQKVGYNYFDHRSEARQLT